MSELKACRVILKSCYDSSFNGLRVVVKQGVVSSSPARVATTKTPLVRKETGNHLVKVRFPRQTSELCIWFCYARHGGRDAVLMVLYEITDFCQVAYKNKIAIKVKSYDVKETEQKIFNEQIHSQN